MRERRWESRGKLTFREVLALGDRLALLGLNPATAKKEIISYIEEWTVPFVHDFSRLDPWTTEDVTLVHIAEKWHGDFFLLTGGYHTVYLNHQATGTYCSVSHPWKIRRELATHYPGGMFWVGFRQAHAFVRVRLHTIEVVPPGETREDARRALWLEERRHAFAEAIEVLNLPIESREEHDRLVLSTPERNVPFFCSWPTHSGRVNSNIIPPMSSSFLCRPDDWPQLGPMNRLRSGHISPASRNPRWKNFMRCCLALARPIAVRRIAHSRRFRTCWLPSLPRAGSTRRSVNFSRSPCCRTRKRRGALWASSASRAGFRSKCG